LYVHRDVHDALTQRFAELASALKVGDPLDPDTDIGPLSSAMQHTKVRWIVQEALAGGAVESPEIQATMPTNGGYWQKPMLLAGPRRTCACCGGKCSARSFRWSPSTRSARRSNWPTTPAEG